MKSLFAEKHELEASPLFDPCIPGDACSESSRLCRIARGFHMRIRCRGLIPVIPGYDVAADEVATPGPRRNGFGQILFVSGFLANAVS